MGGFPAPRHEERNRNLLMFGGVLLLMAVLLFVGRSRGEATSGSGPGFDGSNGTRSAIPRGNYQPAPMVPGAPITSQPGGSPINDAPSVTIIQDVRETMQRYPDRNTPKGWGGRPKKKPG